MQEKLEIIVCCNFWNSPTTRYYLNDIKCSFHIYNLEEVSYIKRSYECSFINKFTPLCRRLSILSPLRIKHEEHPCLLFLFICLFFVSCFFWNEWKGNQKNWDLIFMRDSKLNQGAETYCVQYVCTHFSKEKRSLHRRYISTPFHLNFYFSSNTWQLI